MRARSLILLVPAVSFALAGAACSRSELFDGLFDGLPRPDSGDLDAGLDATPDSPSNDDAPPPPAALSCTNAVFDVCGTNMYQPGAPWPTYQRCSSHAGRSNAVGPTNPAILWQTYSTAGYGVTGPPSIGADGTIYVTGNGQLDAFNPDGTTKWVATLTDLNTGASTVAIGPDGTIFAALDRIYAVSPEGVKKWSSFPLTIPGQTSGFGSLGSSGSSVALGPCGTLFIGCALGLVMMDQSGNEVWAHDGQGLTPAVTSKGESFYSSTSAMFAVAPTGTTEWAFVPEGAPDGGGGWIQPAIVRGADGTVYNAGANALYAISPDGAERWQHPWGTSVTGSLASVALGADDTVYLMAPDATLQAITPAEGKVEWSLPIHASVAPPVVDGNGVIFVLGGATLYAVLPNGTIEWTLIVDNSGQGAFALGADGTLYLTTDGVYAIGNAP